MIENAEISHNGVSHNDLYVYVIRKQKVFNLFYWHFLNQISYWYGLYRHVLVQQHI